MSAAGPDLVKVWIFPPEYECPGHYPWTGPDTPLHEGVGGYDRDKYLIPREQYERWARIQEEWEGMNEEMHRITGEI